MFDVIVVGATFAAAGIAKTFGKNCLIIERRLQAGYEFFEALLYGEGNRIYPELGKAQVRFATEFVSAEETAQGFVCTVFSSEGFSKVEAKRVIDTRVTAEICQEKSFEMLIESKESPDISGVGVRKAKGENHYILSIPISADCDFARARASAKRIVEGFGATQKLILLANEFSYKIKSEYKKTEAGILRLPSVGFGSPEEAFKAGEEVAL